ncbi:MAG: transglycosylase domain-containing protein [Candidatus Rokuibacteriota bacterium]
MFRAITGRWVLVICLCVLSFLGLVAVLAYYEARTSTLQALLLSRYVSKVSYAVESGSSAAIAFPLGGPFDQRRGYSLIPEFQDRLRARGYRVVEQARQSAQMVRLMEMGITPPYRETAAAGLMIRAQGVPLHDVRPRRGFYQRFDDVPALVVNALLYIENRGLTRAADPRSNPAVDWARLAKATMLYAGNKVGLASHVEGGSTLATQLEKYRHSPEGRTDSATDKLRQLAAASLKAYQDGPDTRAHRRRIVVDYLNTMPLSAVPGLGEVSGLGEGLHGWFGLELEDISRALSDPGATSEKARAFKHVLALLYAVRAPSFYLLENRAALEGRITGYANLLEAAGVVDADLRRQVSDVPLRFAEPVAARPPTFVGRKAASAVREELRQMLGVASFYQLDRLDLTVDTSVDAPLQEATLRLFQALEDPAFVQAQGLRAERMLAQGDPRRVIYSLSLFERGPDGNMLRVQADNLDKPFDMNEGMKLELGSTAKLRTLAHYLELMADLHRELSGLDAPALAKLAASGRDVLTRWGAETLGRQAGLDLAAFLLQALERKYSASPYEVFFTGSGVHTFGNFDPKAEDRLVLSVRQALVRSTNLVYIRLMRDIARYHETRLPYDAKAVLTDLAHPDRRRLLREIAEEEERQALWRAYRAYHPLEPDAASARLLRGRKSSARELAKVFYAWHPGANAEELEQWLSERLDGVTPDDAQRLAKAYGGPHLTLSDFGYLLGRHPLEVWVAGEMTRTPSLAWEEILSRSEGVRRQSSAWLFHTRNRRAQDLRLRIRIERDAFARMTPAWRRLGFPFDRLVPSYASAIGSSSDRPAALAELVGIVLNDGVRRPVRAITRVTLAQGTPYHTALQPTPPAGEQVLPVPVAQALRGVLVGVVEQGTAQRLRGAFTGEGREAVMVGAKTGSGDNRFETFARGGGVISSRVVSRTGTVVFFIGDRYYGALTASVLGKHAGSYQFTSALPVAVLRLLAPKISARVAGEAMPPGPVTARAGP